MGGVGYTLVSIAVVGLSMSHAPKRKIDQTVGDGENELRNPLRLISTPLYLPRENQPAHNLRPWEFPEDDKKPKNEKRSEDRFQTLLATQKAFIVGGLGFVVRMGLLASWYRDDKIRDNAIAIIKANGLRRILRSLRDRETGEDRIFGKGEISRFFATLPPVERDEAEARDREQLTSIQSRLGHALRLRKAVEFVALTEAVVRWRFEIGESKARFESITGIEPNGPDAAAHVWNYLWIEPVLYVIDPEPRPPDIQAITQNERIALAFSNDSGQSRGALYWALRGVPGKRKTIDAASEACNRFYGRNAPKTRTVTCEPEKFGERVNLLREQRRGVGLQFPGDVEYLPITTVERRRNIEVPRSAKEDA
jgi:hypothetical protein